MTPTRSRAGRSRVRAGPSPPGSYPHPALGYAPPATELAPPRHVHAPNPVAGRPVPPMRSTLQPPADADPARIVPRSRPRAGRSRLRDRLTPPQSCPDPTLGRAAPAHGAVAPARIIPPRARRRRRSRPDRARCTDPTGRSHDRSSPLALASCAHNDHNSPPPRRSIPSRHRVQPSHRHR
jgi:hypothetical protein